MWQDTKISEDHAANIFRATAGWRLARSSETSYPTTSLPGAIPSSTELFGVILIPQIYVREVPACNFVLITGSSLTVSNSEIDLKIDHDHFLSNTSGLFFQNVWSDFETKYLIYGLRK
jgi:hypothetical protein